MSSTTSRRKASADKLWEGARKDCDPAILDALTAGKE